MFARDEGGVSDVLGNILLVAITVVVASGLILMVLKELVPNATIHADLEVSIQDGDGAWTNGDERVVVRHRGGEALHEKETTIRVLVDGTLHSFTGAALGGAFSDGVLELGESWTHNFTIAEGSEVGVDIIGQPKTGGSLLLATDVVVIQPSAGGPGPIVGGFHYASSFSITRGTMSDFAKLQSASDPGEATLGEAMPAPAVLSLNANAVASSSGWTNPQNGFAAGGGDATNGATNPAVLQYRHADVTGNPGAITKVVLHASASINPTVPSAPLDDGFRLAACSGATCTTASATQGISATHVLITWDVTNLNPVPGSWSWPQINALEDRITPVKTGTRDGTWRVDWAYVEATYTPSQAAMNIQLDFAGAQAATHDLGLKYRVADDTFRVEVYDFVAGTWTPRGGALTSTASVEWTIGLTDDEFNAGAPRIRFVDATPLGAIPGRVFLDYARVGSQ